MGTPWGSIWRSDKVVWYVRKLGKQHFEINNLLRCLMVSAGTTWVSYGFLQPVHFDICWCLTYTMFPKSNAMQKLMGLQVFKLLQTSFEISIIINYYQLLSNDILGRDKLGSLEMFWAVFVSQRGCPGSTGKSQNPSGRLAPALSGVELLKYDFPKSPWGSILRSHFGKPHMGLMIYWFSTI